MFHKSCSSIPLKILIERCIKKDPIAWSDFIKRFSPLVIGAIRKRLGNHSFQFTIEDIADLKQDFFIKLWDKNSLEQIRGIENINYWICMSAANFATDFYRKMRTDILKGSSSLFEEMVHENGHSKLNDFVKAENFDTREKLDIENFISDINRILSEFNQKEMIAAKLHILQGLKYKEVASIMNKPIGSVSTLLKRVKGKIRLKLKENL